METRDYVERRIVVEFGRRYAYVYMTTSDGKLLKDREESFKQPFLLDRRDACEEAEECWQTIYDQLNDTINFPLPEAGPDEADSGEED